MERDDDPLLRQLRDLSTASAQEPLDELKAERVRRRAQAVLAAERRLARWPWLPPLARLGEHALLPLSLSGAVAVYLFWAVQFTSSLYGAQAAQMQAQLVRTLRILTG